MKDTKKLLDLDVLVAQYKSHAPSSMDPRIVKYVQSPSNDDGPLFRCDRPLADNLPGPLLHPTFGEFEDNLHNPYLLTRDDHAFVREFCDKSVQFFGKEIDQQSKIWAIFWEYLKRDISSSKIKAASNIRCDSVSVQLSISHLHYS